MNKRNKQLVALLVLFLLLAAGTFLITKNYSPRSGAFSDFAVIDTASIRKVFLSDREGNTVLLERSGIADWRVNHVHEANNIVVNSLLRTLYNIEVKGIVPRSSHNTVISDMAAKNTKIEIWQLVPRIKIGKLELFPSVRMTKSYYVGGPTPDHHGTYMKLEGSDRAFITYVPSQNAFLSLRYSTRESDWRDHTIVALTINQIDAIDVEIPGRPEESYRIEKAGDREFEVFQYYDQPVTIPLDTSRILEFMASFRNVKYEGLINDMDPDKKDSIITSVPMQIITIYAIDGGVYDITTFRRESPYHYDEVTQKTIKWDRDRLYALINNGKDLTLCQFYVFDDLLKPFSYFRKDFDPTEPHVFYEDPIVPR